MGGVSAGGNLAAVVALMTRDRGLPVPVFQVLEVPVLNLADHEMLRFPDEGIALPSGKDGYAALYLSDRSEATPPYVSPLLTRELSGLPPALIMCAEYDPLAAEGRPMPNGLQRPASQSSIISDKASFTASNRWRG